LRETVGRSSFSSQSPGLYPGHDLRFALGTLHDPGDGLVDEEVDDGTE
jgi:hypothetical protein